LQSREYSYPVRRDFDRSPEGDKDLKVPVEFRKDDSCHPPGCQKEGPPCYLASGDQESIGSNFSDHCQVNGFCSSCGLSCGKKECSDLSNGLSVNRREDLGAELGADERNFDGRLLDEIFDHEESLKYYRGEVPQEASHYDPFPDKIGLRC
jgi:hypothetical protein